jgi:hypothetical protein
VSFSADRSAGETEYIFFFGQLLPLKSVQFPQN